MFDLIRNMPLRSLYSIFLFIFISKAGHADSSNPVDLIYEINLKESIISINGQNYRKIEYRGDTFYLRLLESEKDAGDLELQCNQNSSHLNNMENQILISTSITKRTSLFIDGLKQVCTELKNGHHRVAIHPNIRVGFALEDSPKDILKIKKIFVTPLNLGFGLSSEW